MGWRKLKRNLGVSTVIANMLMISITLALAAILVAWAGTSYGAFSSGSQLFFVQRGQALQERFVIENVHFNSSASKGNFIRIFVRDTGVEEIRVVAIYINGTSYTPTGAGGTCNIPAGGYLLTVGAVCEFRITWNTWTNGAVYYIVVATARGNQATFIARGPPPLV